MPSLPIAAAVPGTAPFAVKEYRSSFRVPRDSKDRLRFPGAIGLFALERHAHGHAREAPGHAHPHWPDLHHRHRN